MILTLTHPQDLQAFAVRVALGRKGRGNVLWMVSDLAQRQRATIEVDGVREPAWSVVARGLDLGSGPVAAIWHHRPEPPVVTEALHPADRRFAEREYEELLRWLIESLSRVSFWVNPLAAARRAESKIGQQRAARRAGLVIPRTLYTNDPERIRSFLSAAGGRIVYKPFRMHGPWVTSDRGFAYPYTSILSADGLPGDEVLRATPGIYQELLAKAYELRVTVIGRRVFSARLDSQATRDGRVDWRRAYGDLLCERAQIPAGLERAILRLMEELGLVFGCLDFILTPDGEYFFLEVNEMGQFLFVERDTGMPLLDAFCEMLLQGTPDYRWDPSRATVSYRELEPEIVALKEKVSPQHVQPAARVAGLEIPQPAQDDP